MTAVVHIMRGREERRRRETQEFALQPATLDVGPIDRADVCAGQGCRVVVLPLTVCWQMRVNGRVSTWCQSCWPTGEE